MQKRGTLEVDIPQFTNKMHLSLDGMNQERELFSGIAGEHRLKSIKNHSTLVHFSLRI